MAFSRQPETDWSTWDGHADEYERALAAWPLEMPPGVTLPPLPAAEPEPGALYQRGAGEVAVIL